MLSTLAAISIGAAFGAVLRWVLGNALNAWFPHIPPGTVAANMIGAYVIGLAIAYFGSHPSLPAHWRLFVITGFCGGLTTFSTFSAELAALIQSERLGWAVGSIVVHVGGSLGLTLLGIGTARLLRLTT